MMEYYTTRGGNNLLVVRGKSGKIIRAYSGAIAKRRWNEMFNFLNLN